jgi:hypothetical protein
MPLRPSLAVADDLQGFDEARQLARIEQVLGAGGAAVVPRVLARVRFAQEQASRRERPHQRGKERPVEIVEDEDEVVLPLSERDGVGLEVEHFRRHRQTETTRHGPQRLDARGIVVHRPDEGPCLREHEGVSPATAGDVERAGAARREPHELEEPGRRARGRRRPAFEAPRPAAQAPDEVVHARNAGLCEVGRRATRADSVAVHDEDRAAIVGHDGRGRGEAVHRQEQRARNVALLRESRRRSHVEDARAGGDEPERLLGSDVLVTAGAAGYSGWRGQDP